MATLQMVGMTCISTVDTEIRYICMVMMLIKEQF